MEIDTSDLHGNKDAFYRYSSLLQQKFDMGVISGDLLDDAITLKTMKDTLSLEDDDLLEELYDPEDTVDDLDDRVRAYKSDPNSLLSQTMMQMENEYRQILNLAGKPVILIPGNHDLSSWESRDNLINIHNSSTEIEGITFVGFRYTSLELSQAERCERLEKIKPLIKNDTILVTHAPPFGILDERRKGISLGCKCIRSLVDEYSFLYHLFGHVHDSFGNEGIHINGAYEGNEQFVSIDTNTRNIISV